MNDYTYIAADFDHDKDAVESLNYMKKKGLIVFKDAHEIQQSNDTSLACSIKKSLKMRMNHSNKFILIVGEHTNTVSKGGCQLCSSYNSHTYSCARGNFVDYRSFIKYECDMADEAGISIVVLYKNTKIDRELCPEIIRFKGVHSAMIYYGTDGKYHWDYMRIAKAIGN